ncbi:alkaline phosphatase family protein, partial [Acinetobacter baumannii]
MNTAILNPSIQHTSTPFIAPKLFTAKRMVNT